MTRSIRRAASAALIATMLLMASALPAAAVKIQGEGYYARFVGGSDDGQSMVIVDRVDSNSGRVNALLVGLLGSEEYFVVGRSIGCNGTPSNGNRVFRALGVADLNGDMRVSGAYELKNVLVSSIWIGRTDGGGTPVCQMSLNFEEIKVNIVADYNGDAAAGAAAHEYGHVMMLVEKRPNSRARVSIVATGLEPGDDYTFRGVNKACGKSPTATPLAIEFEDVVITSQVRVEVVDLSQTQLDSLRSLRIRNVTEGTNIGCVPLSIIAILIGG